MRLEFSMEREVSVLGNAVEVPRKASQIIVQSVDLIYLFVSHLEVEYVDVGVDAVFVGALRDHDHSPLGLPSEDNGRRSHVVLLAQLSDNWMLSGR